MEQRHPEARCSLAGSKFGKRASRRLHSSAEAGRLSAFAGEVGMKDGRVMMTHRIFTIRGAATMINEVCACNDFSIAKFAFDNVKSNLPKHDLVLMVHDGAPVKAEPGTAEPK